MLVSRYLSQRFHYLKPQVVGWPKSKDMPLIPSHHCPFYCAIRIGHVESGSGSQTQFDSIPWQFLVHSGNQTYETQIGFNQILHLLSFIEGGKEGISGGTSSSQWEARQLLPLLRWNMDHLPRRANGRVGPLIP